MQTPFFYARISIMAIKFITSNQNKFNEIRDTLAPIAVEMVPINLDEIQSLDAKEIIAHKLEEAKKQQEGELIVEDTSLYLECLNFGLPGPFIKWYLDVLGAEGIAKMAIQLGATKAYAKTYIGLSKGGVISFFEGRNDGQIVMPTGDKDFGWGPIFKPNDSNKTYGEMDREEKYALSMRAQAALSLKDYLLQP